MMKKTDDDTYGEIVKQYEFGVYKYIHTTDAENRLYKKYAIVIREAATKLIVRFTDYADKLIYRRRKDFNVFSGDVGELYIVCQLLNFVLIKMFKIYRIRDVRDITFDMLQQWLDEYSSTKLPSGFFPTMESVRKHRRVACIFGWMLCHDGQRDGKPMRYLKKVDLITSNYVTVPADSFHIKNRKTYEYHLFCHFFNEDMGLQKLNRDMPLCIIERFVKIAEIYDPELVLAIVLASYIGLREGEICNLRQNRSKYGASLIITRMYGEAVVLQVDLTKELLMRSDRIDVGGIKRENFRNALPSHVRIIDYYLQEHLQMIKDKPCEDSYPLFLNRNKKNGVYMAMTKDGFRKRIMKLFEKVLASCKDDPNLDLQRYYAEMTAMDKQFGPHNFRHTGTVRAVLAGVDESTLMGMRGDKSPRSAQTYTKNKGALYQRYMATEEMFANLIRQKKEEKEHDN